MIIFLVVSAALLAGDGAEAMTAVIMAVLAAVTEQLVRAALRYRTRAV